jgi:hypothetical protein
MQVAVRARTSTASCVRLALVFVALCSVELAAATTATGQIRSVGVSGVPNVGSSVSDGDVVALAYDDKADVTLYVWSESGPVRNLLGRFVRFDGTLVGGNLVIAGDAGNPRVAYSSGSNGDLFAVTYGNNVQFVRYTGTGPSGGALVGSPVAVPNASDVIFSTVTDQFIVASVTTCCSATVDVWLFDAAGTPAGGPIPITPAPTVSPFEAGGPRLALDVQDERLLVTYLASYGISMGLFRESTYRVVEARTFAGVAGPTSYAGCTGGAKCLQFSETEVAFSVAAGKFVLAWTQPESDTSPDPIARRTLVTPNGAQIDTATIITGTFWNGGPPAVGVAYEPRAGKTVIAVVLGPNPDRTGQPLRGAILDAAGAPLATNLVLSSTLSVASPAIVATRAAQVAVGYDTFSTPQMSTFERFTLSNPRSNLDGPAPGVVVGRSFTLQGWAADVGSSVDIGVDAVHGWAFPHAGGAAVFLGVGAVSVPRPDIAAIFGPNFVNSGYSFNSATLPPGAYSIVVYPHSSLSGQFETGTVSDITVAGSLPQTRLDIPSDGASVSTRFSVGGWAIDRAAPVSTDAGVDVVHVWAFSSTGTSTFVAAIPVNRPRTDIAGLYGSQFLNAGYQLDGVLLPPGVYQIVAYGHSTVSGTFDASNAAAVTIAAPTPHPVMALDTPTAGATIAGQFAVAGWAADLGASSGTGTDAVHVWAFPTNGSAPIFLGVATYGGSRPDVGAIYGAAFTNSGYSLVAVFVPPGNYNLAVYAHSTVSLTFNQVKAVTIQVH